ncbi:MAG: response regulator [Gemmatimonadetes bacterium]|nr:response regulator [Gemmatimonadota bacterium]MBK7714928.1 response regulator [Gemmatimonadota bacterium]MBK7783990.1 response regulator [Gemmatimonadota bacterium]MBK9067964.1 response regulator [Gemmatimonadota bacterium]MBP6671060.1 response regulator [Gemmatimonadales bacterium]
MRALVVDDSRAIRSIIGKTVKELGFELFEAGHGKEALDRLAEVGKVDLILVDWNMPEMNGFDFLVAARGNPAWKDTVIMMVTTETEMSQMQRALEAGANEYVMKPFTKDVLREKLQLVGLAAG